MCLAGLVLVSPLVTLFWILSIAERHESRIRRVVTTGISLYAASAVLLSIVWMVRYFQSGFSAEEFALGVLYESHDYDFPIVFYLDKVAAVYLFVTALLSAATLKFSVYYMHREPGYRRFFATVFGLIFGMSFLSLAGTLDLFFVGWEVVGMCSFLLIGFYRDRIIPVRNAYRTYAVYRLCDIGLLVGAWMGHLIWHHSQHFMRLEEISTHLAYASQASIIGLSFLILLAAAGKSAQFPFSYWLPRAMEGPTPSSAIFYGGLSIHAGVLLLLRTMPIWTSNFYSCLAVGVFGVISSVLGTLSSRVQSNIKGQIAYASISQVGLMLVELSLGLENLVLFHFSANAFLRTYQLLVSPSVVAHLLKVQSQENVQRKLSLVERVSDWSLERLLPTAGRSSLYVLALNEGYMESLIKVLIWQPLKRIGRTANRLDGRALRFVFLGFGAICIAQIFAKSVWAPSVSILVGGALLFSISAFGERQSWEKAWNAVGLGSLFTALSVWAGTPSASYDVLVFLIGGVPFWAFGVWTLRRLEKKVRQPSLDAFHGLAGRDPVGASGLLVAFMGLSGFPISPVFLGEDLLLHHATGDHLSLAVAICAVFVLNGLTLARLYAHVSLGPSGLDADAFGSVESSAA